MRIGVNALYLIPGGVGGTKSICDLSLPLAEIDSTNQYFVFTNLRDGADLVPPQPNFTHVPQAVRAVSRPARLLWEQTALPLAAARLGLDVLFNPGFTAPLFCGCRQVTVFHDLQHKRHPEYFRWFDLPFWNFFLYWSAHVSRVIVAVSSATRDDLLRWYRLPPASVRTIPSGVDPNFFPLAERREVEPFLFAVSTLHPHKNLDGLLRAFAIFRKSHPEYRLIVSGIHGFYSPGCTPSGGVCSSPAKSSSPAGSRVKISMISTAAPPFLYPASSKASACPCSRPLPQRSYRLFVDARPLNESPPRAAKKFDCATPPPSPPPCAAWSTTRALPATLAAAGRSALRSSIGAPPPA